MEVKLKISNEDNYRGVVGSKKFEIIVFFSILLATIITGLKTFELSSDVLSIVNTIDYLITLWFSIEITARIYYSKDRVSFLKNPWNIFDIVVISLLLIPIEESELAAFGRVIRIVRIMRLLVIVPQLRTLSSALIRSIPQLSYVVVLMFVIFYMYAAVGTVFFSEINPDLWSDIGVAMLTLFRIMTFEDWTDIMYETMSVYPLSFIYYISFIFVTAFATLNLVIGILTANLEEEYVAGDKEETSRRLDRIEEKLDKLMNK